MSKAIQLAVSIGRAARILFGLALVMTAFSATAFARGVPEIEPGTASSALTLLIGGVLLLKGRLGRR